jgi:hypothetical protein
VDDILLLVITLSVLNDTSQWAMPARHGATSWLGGRSSPAPDFGKCPAVARPNSPVLYWGQLMHLRINKTIRNPRMRPALLLLTPLLLTGCINETATYFIDGNEHAISVRARQDYFWSDEVELRVVAARMPDCQRQLVLGKLPIADLRVELFAGADNAYTLRAGDQLWQVETGGCTQLEAPARAALGQPQGAFHLDERKKLVFEKAAQPPVAGAAPAA